MTLIEQPMAAEELVRLVRSAVVDLRFSGWRYRRAESEALRSGVRLVEGSDHEVWLLRWPVGSRVTPHDHGISAGAFTVVSGTLTEVRWSEGVRYEQIRRPREVVAFRPGVVHDVVATDRPAYSVHAYSPRLMTMSFYAEDGETLLHSRDVADAPIDFIDDPIV